MAFHSMVSICVLRYLPNVLLPVPIQIYISPAATLLIIILYNNLQSMRQRMKLDK